MKFVRRTSFSLLILFLFIMVFRGPLYRSMFCYKTTGQRIEYAVSDKQLFVYIDAKTTGYKPEDIKDIITLSLSITSDCLNFTEGKNNNDPNKLIYTKEAHCIGYAAFFSTICNHLLNKYGYTGQWISKPLVGQIYFLGINIHSFSDTPFFKDHDFNSIENKQTGEKYFTDPTVNDYFWIDFITAK